ncbi:MAG: LacI family DNA-binding transcriptional regulator [Cellulomonas sp.]
MRDVAVLAGVSIKTVSRVVNEESGVSVALAERVNRAAAALTFRPDLTAGSLRRTSRRTNSIGLVLASVDNPFCGSIHRAVEDVAADRGVAVFSASTDEQPQRERAMVAAFASRRVDGLILSVAGDDQEYLVGELASGTPIVLVDRPAVGIDVDTVLVDNAAGARVATNHLLNGGHRRIAFLGDLPRIATAQQRRAGYLLAMTDAGAPVDDRLVDDGIHSAEAAVAAVVTILQSDNPPTALFTSQNLITIGAIRALRSLGLQHDIALVGFDDFALADLMEPEITVVSQDPVAMGRTAAGLLFSRLDGAILDPQHVTLPTTLVCRGSGEIRAPGR